MDSKYRYITKIERNCDIYKRSTLKGDCYNSNELLALHFIRHNEGTSQDKIASYLDVDKALVTRIVKKLEVDGLIKKVQDDNDKRNNKIYSTHKASNLKNELVDIEMKYYTYLFEDLSNEEKKLFFNTLEKIYLKSKKARKEGFYEIK